MHMFNTVFKSISEKECTFFKTINRTEHHEVTHFTRTLIYLLKNTIKILYGFSYYENNYAA